MTRAGVHILINAQSGTILKMGEQAVRECVENSGLAVKSLHILPPDDLFKKVKDYQNKEGDLLIGGGDGTVRQVSELFMDREKPFGIIPLGTMNLMGHDLNIPDQLAEALAAYAKGYERIDIDVGMVNAVPFLCCTGLGTMPEASEFREEKREESTSLLVPRLFLYILEKMDRAQQRTVQLSIDGKKKKLRTVALVVSNNQYIQKSSHLTDNNFKRRSLQDGTLGVYSAAPATLWDKIRLLFKLKLGGWKNDPVLKSWSAETLSISTRADEQLLSVDGETVRLTAPLNFWIKPQALPLLVPKDNNTTEKTA